MSEGPCRWWVVVSDTARCIHSVGGSWGVMLIT